MGKRWGVIVWLSLIFLGGGCKEKTDNGTEAKAVLRGTATPGGHRTLTPAVSQRRPSPHLLRPARSVPAPSVPRKPEMLGKMGIEVEQGRISIDTRKARNYFEALERQLSQGVNQGVQRARRHASGADDIGIHVSRDRVEIDLNKTKNFLKIWGESMKILGEELDNSLQPSP